MKMTKAEFEALRQRVSQAYFQSYKVANTAEYVAALGGGAAPLDIEPFSTAHLYYLIQQIDAGTLETAKEDPAPEAIPAQIWPTTPDVMEAVKDVVEASNTSAPAEVPVVQVTVKKTKKKSSA